ncbi:MAG: response regulator [Candidatus Cloacimonadota bacterium]
MTIPRILIVDDEQNILVVLSRTLETAGYEISTASSGKEALELIGSSKYDLVILDLRLPDLDGLQVLKAIDKMDLESDVVMITAHGNVDVAVEAMKNGCVDFIQKPFDADHIRKVVDDILARRSISSQQLVRFETLLELAKLDAKERKYSQAILKIQEALELDPENAAGYNFLGVLYEITDDIHSAIKAYQMALSLDRSNADAKLNLDRVRGLSVGSGMIFG